MQNRKFIILATLLVIIAGGVIYGYSERDSKIPKNFILSQESEASHSRKIKQDSVAFDTASSTEELVSHYKKQFEKRGWAVEIDQGFPGESHRLFAAKKSARMNIFIQPKIFRPGEAAGARKSVAIHLFVAREGVEYK